MQCTATHSSHSTLSLQAAHMYKAAKSWKDPVSCQNPSITHKRIVVGPADSTHSELRSTGSGAFGDLPPGEPLEPASISQPTSQVASRTKTPDMAAPLGPGGTTRPLSEQQLPPQLPFMTEATMVHVSLEQPMQTQKTPYGQLDSLSRQILEWQEGS